MNHEILSSIEIDAIGEIVNISLGSSATAVSNMLNARVDITVPRVRVESYDEFEFKNLEPAIAVTIDYVQGITGNNIMILKREDIKVILEMLMGTEIEDENFELDEISLSAVREVMNQMMGASSTALSELMGRMINISTPTTFEVKDAEEFKENHFEIASNFVVIEFDLSIEGKLKSEFMNVMPIHLVKDMVESFIQEMNLGSDLSVVSTPEIKSDSTSLSQEQIEAMMNQASEEQNESKLLSQEEIEAMLAGAQETEKISEPASSGGMLSQEAIEKMLQESQDTSASSAPVVANTPPATVSQPSVSQMSNANSSFVSNSTLEPRVIEVRETQRINDTLTGVPKQENVDMLMDVPLVVSVEIGRTKKPIKEILEITQGSLIVLDKMAGDQVEVYANNRCIARGDVVVVHDNFGIRVTEILGKG